jgi:hypothetical protein
VLFHGLLSNSFIHPILQHLVLFHLNLYGDILHVFFLLELIITC